MESIDQAPDPNQPTVGLRMPDTISRLTGAWHELVPAMLESIWATMRGNVDSCPELQGDDQEVRDFVAENYAVSTKRNFWLARALNRRLRQRYNFHAGPDTWIPRAFYTFD